MDPKKILNWREVSRVVSGNDQSIRANKIPNKYKKDLDKLLSMIETWVKEVEEK